MTKADQIILNQRRRLLKHFQQTIKEYKKLNDALYILKTNPIKLRKQLANYIHKLNGAIEQFISGDGRTNSVIKNITKKAQYDFINALDKFDMSVKLLNERKLYTSVIKEQSQRWRAVTNRLQVDQLAKMTNFKLMSEMAKIPANTVSEIGKRTMVYVKGQAYRADILNSFWQQATQSYGRYEQVVYGTLPNAKKTFHYPLRSWADMRSRSTAEETHRLTTQIEATSNEVYTGIISSHNSKDSCIFHENRIFFFSDAARQIFLKRYPHITQAKSWMTLNELKNDATHIFKHNCAHVTTPYPIYLFDTKDMQKEIKDSNTSKVPKDPVQTANAMFKDVA